MFGDTIHRYLYIFFLSGIAFSLPVSKFMTSVFIIALAVNWLLSKYTYHRLKKINSNKPLLVFLTIYLLYIIYMLNTLDTGEGLSVLMLKLPLLIIPLVIATTGTINIIEKRIILSSFLAGVFIASVTGTLYFFIIADDMSDRSVISLFVSHISLSLMACFSFFISAYYTLVHDNVDFRFKYIYVLLAIWFAVFLVLLMSNSGLIIFLAVLIYSSYRISQDPPYSRFAPITRIVIPVLFAGLLFFVVYMVYDFYSINEKQSPDYSAKTENGRPYTHISGNESLENGYYIWRYICEEELRNEWNKRSSLGYDGKDLKKQNLKNTLIRYMTSLGLKKDSAALSKLSDKDIDMIETGFPNYRYKDGTGPADSMYELIWQADYYFKGGKPQGHSLTRRVEFFITGLRVFKKYPVFGTGTGDLTDEFRKQYKHDNPDPDNGYRIISHNQYLSILVTFGITGFALFMFALCYPLFKSGSFSNYLFTVFFIIILMWMLIEDILEIQTGIVFFSLFYALFIFGSEKNKSVVK